MSQEDPDERSVRNIWYIGLPALLILLGVSATFLSSVPLSQTDTAQALKCSTDSTPCQDSEIRERPTSCTDFYEKPVQCNYTTENLGDVSLITDVSNYVTLPWTDARYTAHQFHGPGYWMNWDLEFLPDGRSLLTLNRGRVVLFNSTTSRERRIVLNHTVLTNGKQGMLGLAVHPDFPDPAHIYLYHTDAHAQRNGSEQLVWNRVSRFRLENGQLRNETVLVDEILGGRHHNGGRLEFGPDGMLYVTTGDPNYLQDRPPIAQQQDHLSGKVLRLHPDGSIPEDNPFNGSPVYSIGHRNPQGIAWDPETGDMYASEHGPKRLDEINRIRPQGNYGWPLETCGGPRPTYDPVVCYQNWTLAPSGMTFVDQPEHPWHGDLFVTGLRGQHLERISIDGDNITGQEIFYVRDPDSEIQGTRRLRDVEFHDGSLWVVPERGDIIRLTPQDDRQPD